MVIPQRCLRIASSLLVVALALSASAAMERVDKNPLPLETVVVSIAEADRVRIGESVSDGLHRIRGWVSRGEEAITFRKNEAPAGRFPPGGEGWAKAFQGLADAYGTGELDRVVALYDAASQPQVIELLSSEGVADSWGQFVRSIRSISPLVAWESGGQLVWMLRVEASDEQGRARSLTLPIAMTLDAESPKFVAADVQSTLMSEMSNAFRNPDTDPVSLVANYDWIMR